MVIGLVLDELSSNLMDFEVDQPEIEVWDYRRPSSSVLHEVV